MGIVVWLITFGIMLSNSKYIFAYCEKLKAFVKTFTPYNQIIICEEQLCMPNMGFYI